MHYLKDTGFILKRVNFGDSDRYITIFTKHNGKIEVVARGVRKITSRRASACELLNLIEFQSISTRKNYILTETRLIDPFENLKRDLKNIEKVFTTCELIDAILPINARHTDVFELMIRALSKMEDEKTLIYFQAKLLSILGYWDRKVPFRDRDHVRHHIEMILERKLRTPNVFGS